MVPQKCHQSNCKQTEPQHWDIHCGEAMETHRAKKARHKRFHAVIWLKFAAFVTKLALYTSTSSHSNAAPILFLFPSIACTRDSWSVVDLLLRICRGVTLDCSEYILRQRTKKGNIIKLAKLRQKPKNALMRLHLVRQKGQNKRKTITMSTFMLVLTHGECTPE